MDIKGSKLMESLPQSVSARPREVPAQDIRRGNKEQHSIQNHKSVNPSADKMKEDLAKLIDQLNQRLSGSALKFEIDRTLKMPIIKVVDEADNRVIRQIPGEEALARMKAISHFLEDGKSYGSDAEKEAITGFLLNHLS